jgi:hypothetical protein
MAVEDVDRAVGAHGERANPAEHVLVAPLEFADRDVGDQFRRVAPDAAGHRSHDDRVADRVVLGLPGGRARLFRTAAGRDCENESGWEDG